MSKERLLLTLLIHRYSREKYYQRHDQYVEKQKKLVEEGWQQSFESIPKDRQSQFLDMWFFPPWRFNSIVGYAEIELETDWTVIGHLYLPEGRFSRSKPLMLNYACASAGFEQGNLEDLRRAICDVVEDLRTEVAEHKWVLEFDPDWVNFTDFLGMIKP